jgi:hypothetical protein
MRILAILGLSLVISSCTVSHHISFNKDYSGTFDLKVDMSAMYQMMGDAEGQDGFFTEEEALDLQQRIGSVSGVGSPRVLRDAEAYTIIIRFNFKDLETLNRVYTMPELQEGMTSVGPYFAIDKKTLTYKWPQLGEPEEGNEMDEMGEMFLYNFTMDVPRKVKSVKGPLSTQEGKKTVKLDGSLYHYITNPEIPALVVEMK